MTHKAPWLLVSNEYRGLSKGVLKCAVDQRVDCDEDQTWVVDMTVCMDILGYSIFNQRDSVAYQWQ